MAFRSYGLVASLTYLPSTKNSPEYILLRRIAGKSAYLARCIAERYGEERLMRLAVAVLRRAVTLPRGRTQLSCEKAQVVDWLRWACASYSLLRALDKKGVARPRRGLDAAFVEWRLYEIYVYYLIYDVLTGMGFREVACGGADLCFEGPAGLAVYFSSPGTGPEWRLTTAGRPITSEADPTCWWRGTRQLCYLSTPSSPLK